MFERQPPHPEPERLLLRVPEAAKMTGLGLTKAYELVATGEWPSVTIGRCVRVPLAGLRLWVERRQRGGLDKPPTSEW
jgi:excisionase family DNA binding protein